MRRPKQGGLVKPKKAPTPAKVLRLHADHPLIGTWVVADDSSSIEFQIRPKRQGFEVAASDSYAGEEFVVSEVHWDGRALRFELLVPSNGTRAIARTASGASERRFTYAGIKFHEARGWYRVDKTVADYLRGVRQVPADEVSQLAFDVCTEEEAKALDTREESEAKVRKAPADDVRLSPARADLSSAELVKTGTRVSRKS